MIEFTLKQIYRNKQIIKYLMSGGTGAFVDLSLLFILTDILDIWYLYSAIMAYIAAFFVGFHLQKFWTFRDSRRDNMHKQMALYFAVGATNLCVNSGGMYMLVDKLNIMYILAQIIMGLLVAISSFLIYKFFIFKKHKIETEKYYNNSLKVLIATGIFPPDIGGPAAMLKDFVKSLVDRGFEARVITYAEEKEHGWLDYTKKKVEIFKIKRHRIALIGRLFYLRRILELARWANVIYATDTYSVGYFAYLANKIMGVKYIIRFAGDSAWETAVSKNWIADYIADFQNKVYDDRIEKIKNKRKKILINADKVIAVCNFMANIAREIGVKEDKIKIIYNSVDFMDGLEVSEKDIDGIKSNYGGDKKIIVTSCRLTPWKGVDGVIKILPELMKKIGKINFLVLGDGPEMESLNRLAKEYNVSENVHFLGRIKHEETIKYFKAADLYILNSNYEGLSHALLDVMKCEVPIITTNAGGNPELIEDGKDGLLVGYNNKEELLNASVKILTNEQLAKGLSISAKEKVKKFSWDNTVNETVKLLREYKLY